MEYFRFSGIMKTADNEIRYFVRWNRDTEKYSKLSIVCENITPRLFINGDRIVKKEESFNKIQEIVTRKAGFEQYESLGKLDYGKYRVFLKDESGEHIEGCERIIDLNLKILIKKDILQTRDNNYVYLQISCEYMIPNEYWKAYVEGLESYLIDFPEMVKNTDKCYVTQCLVHRNAVSHLRLDRNIESGLNIIVE